LARNLKGTAFCMKYQLPAIERSGGGAIVNCASSAGLRAPANYGAYAAAKGGVIALTRAVAAEGGAKNIRVNSIAIGTIETPAWRGSSESVLQGVRDKNPLGRMGKPEEIAGTILWLCSEAAGFVTGQCISVDGGDGVIAKSLRTVGF